MKKQIFPIADITLEEILDEYIQYGFLKNLPRFNARELLQSDLENKGFSREGMNDFYLMEKSFRLFGKETIINLKLYFWHGKYFSNGLDLFGINFSDAIDTLMKYKNQISDLELLFNNDNGFGSLLVNNKIELRFDRKKFSKNKVRYIFTGISSDHSIISDEIPISNISHARGLKEKITLKMISENKKISNETRKFFEEIHDLQFRRTQT